MNTRTLAIACFLMIFGISAHAQWVQTNSPKNDILTFGGDITCLATMGNDLFAGTASAGLILSTDSATTWSALHILPSFFNFPLDIGALCVSGGNLFAATGDALYLSTDSGASWHGLSFPSDSNARSISAITVSGGNLIVGISNDSTRLLTDTGTSWIAIDSLVYINSFAVMNGNLFAGTYYGVFRSTNNGVNWTRPDTTPMYVYALAVNGNDLFADTYYGVSLSTNDGASWTAIDSGLHNLIITSLAVSGGNIFAGTDGNGVFVSTNNGSIWNPAGDTGLINATINALLVDSGKLYAATYGGAFLSTDNGADWSVHNPITVLDAAVNSMDTIGGKLFASTQVGLFSTSDSGAIWTPDSAGGNISVTAAVSIGDNIFVGTNAGDVLLSTDNGASWTAVDSGLTGQELSVTTLIQNDGVLYAATEGGIFLSTNNGISWIGPGAVGADALAVMGRYLIAGSSAPGTVYYSLDSGKFWSGADAPIMASNDFAIIGGDVYMGTNGDGVWRSTDSGNKWMKQNNIGLTDSNMTTLLANGTTLYTGTGVGHIFVSQDSGANWEPIDSGLNLGGTEITSLAIKDSILYAGTIDSGIWRHSLSKTVKHPSAVLQTPASSSGIQIYPNPAMSSITVTSSAGPISILDPLGRSYEVPTTPQPPPTPLRSAGGGVTLDISALPSGVYFVSDGVSRVKFVKE